MNANDVLIDILEDNRRRLHRSLNTMSDACMIWQPDPEANNIAITIWHMARILDVFLTQQAKGQLSEQEHWFCSNWAAQIGYDPHGTGLQGWGMLTGYSHEETTAIPKMDKEQSLKYLDEVYNAVEDYLIITPIEDLEQPAPGFEGRFSKYQCIQMALLDNIRHLGEIFALEASWKRKQA
ncbi:MAG: DinB family protein [Anaerolineaceae bacterium]|nr:DinB family protein [Anaerolineaceae bacterium]